MHSGAMTYRSTICRLKALTCEKRAQESTDPSIKESWQELAIEWHTIANATAKADDDACQLQFS